MIVRCGRCRVELEVAGPGEFLCPACGTRNAVRGAGAASPLGGSVPGSLGGSPFGDVAGAPASTPPPPGPPPQVDWITCGDCGYRFVVGDVPEAPCPTCGALVVIPGKADSDSSGGEDSSR